jgi:sulfur carrier protein ThiS
MLSGGPAAPVAWVSTAMPLSRRGSCLASITVKLYGTLNRYLPEGKGVARIDLAPPATTGELLEKLDLPVELLDALFLNGKLASLDTQLSEGDLLEAFPFLGGGT